MSSSDVKTIVAKLERIIGIETKKEDNESVQGYDVGSDDTLTPATVRFTPPSLPSTLLALTTPLGTTSKIDVLHLPSRNRRSLDSATSTDRDSVASTVEDVFHTPFSTIRHANFHHVNVSTGDDDDFCSAAGSVHSMMVSSPPHAPPSVLQSRLGKKMSYVNPNEKLFSESEVKVQSGGKSKGNQTKRDGTKESTLPQPSTPQSLPPVPPTCHHFSDTTDCLQDGIRHFIASAKTGDGVPEIFDYLTRRILAIREQEQIEEREEAALREETIVLREEEEERKRKERKRGCC